MHDQAQALRELVLARESAAGQAGAKPDDGPDAPPGARATRVVTVTSGKGGVGKSNFSLNFAIALRNRGHRVLVFDADIGLANIDVLLGTPARYNLVHLLRREKTIWDIVQEGPGGLRFIAGGSGFQDLVRLSEEELEYFVTEVAKLHGHFDFVLFDTGAGLSKETVRFIAAADETIVVTTPEPTAVTDAYALIKMVNAMGQRTSFRLVINRVSDEREGRQTAEHFRQVAARFLGLDIPPLGYVPDDHHVSRAVKRQTPLLHAFPNCPAARGIDRIAANFLTERQPAAPSGIRGFLQRMKRLWD